VVKGHCCSEIEATPRPRFTFWPSSVGATARCYCVDSDLWNGTDAWALEADLCRNGKLSLQVTPGERAFRLIFCEVCTICWTYTSRICQENEQNASHELSSLTEWLSNEQKIGHPKKLLNNVRSTSMYVWIHWYLAIALECIFDSHTRSVNSILFHRSRYTIAE
jgi:hypothetical protein